MKKEEIAAWTGVQLYEALQHRGDDELRRRLGRATLALAKMYRHMQNRLQGKTARSAYSSVSNPRAVRLRSEEVEMSCKRRQSHNRGKFPSEVNIHFSLVTKVTDQFCL